MFDIVESEISGCFEIKPKIFDDERGRFVKIFHEEAFQKLGLETNFPEEYYSTSNASVIRGLHFQIPPMDHVKMVFCVEGQVMDVVVDLRIGSPTYGKHASFDLSDRAANSIYIPKGMAHGFFVKSKKAIMVYKVSTVYSPAHDAGLHWNSVGIAWPSASAIVSARDAGFASLENFSSPFTYDQH